MQVRTNAASVAGFGAGRKELRVSDAGVRAVSGHPGTSASEKLYMLQLFQCYHFSSQMEMTSPIFVVLQWYTMNLLPGEALSKERER